MRRLTTALLLTAALAITGCGVADGASHDEHGEAAPIADGARTIEITAKSFSFEPSAVEVSAGEDLAVALTSVDAEHDFVIDELDFHVAAEPGETAQAGLRIDTPGTYTAYCSVAGHREAGMQSTVTVSE